MVELSWPSIPTMNTPAATRSKNDQALTSAVSTASKPLAELIAEQQQKEGIAIRNSVNKRGAVTRSTSSIASRNNSFASKLASDDGSFAPTRTVYQGGNGLVLDVDPTDSKHPSPSHTRALRNSNASPGDPVSRDLNRRASFGDLFGGVLTATTTPQRLLQASPFLQWLHSDDDFRILSRFFTIHQFKLGDVLPESPFYLVRLRTHPRTCSRNPRSYSCSASLIHTLTS